MLKKQRSNETNTSLIGSFNIGQIGAGHELSADSNDVYASCTAQSSEHNNTSAGNEDMPQSSKSVFKYMKKMWK